MTTPDIAGLCERLRRPHGGAYRKEAADTLERQAAEIARLREALENADRRLSRPDWTVQRDTVRTSIRAALTGEES